MQPVEYKLEEPIQYGSDLIEKVSLKPMTPLMLDDVPADPALWKMGDVHKILLAMTGWERPVLAKLSGVDYRALQERMSDFLQKFLGTGEINSAS